MNMIILRTGLYRTIKNIIKRDSYIRRKLLKLIISNGEVISDYNNVKIYTSLNSAIESNLIHEKYNETQILDFINRYKSKIDLFIDIGANIGLHSMVAANDADTLVLAIEPELNNVQKIIKNKALNNLNNVQILTIAAGEQIGYNYLNINDGWNNGKHSLVNTFGSNKQLTTTLPIDSLESIYNQYHKIMVKIDVEGFELQAVNGSKQLLKKNQCGLLIIELINEFHTNNTIESILNILHESGFKYTYKFEVDRIKKVDKYDGSGDYLFAKTQIS